MESRPESWSAVRSSVMDRFRCSSLLIVPDFRSKYRRLGLLSAAGGRRWPQVVSLWSQRSWRHNLAHSVSCGFSDRRKEARERGRHNSNIYAARIRGLERLARIPTAHAVG
jgi:hypothetical protein